MANDLPDVIYAGADSEDGWRWPMASKFPTQHSTPLHAFIRADALPDKVDIYRAIKKSGVRNHGDIAQVIADLYTYKKRCAECDCENGGSECTWITPKERP